MKAFTKVATTILAKAQNVGITFVVLALCVLFQDAILPPCLLVAAGLEIGSFDTAPSSVDGNGREAQDGPLNISALHAEAVEDISAERLREQLKYFTAKPHVAASIESYQLANYIQEKWKQFGLDTVELKKYNVLISVPEKPGVVTLKDESGDELFRTAPFEKVLDPAENSSSIMPPFSEFSPSGNVTGRLVYAYFGRRKDYLKLEDLGVNVTGKIVIIRYGRGGRTSKIKRATKLGAVAAILYPDPEEFAQEGLDKVYPEFNWLPRTAVLRGNIKGTRYGGDPLTPEEPSIDGIHRVPVNDIKERLPQIPVIPISYGDAEHLLRTLRGDLPRFYWRGGLPIIYGVQTDANDTRSVTVTVNNKLVRRDIYNVIGFIKGSDEPDHLVIIGNHRDSWVFGASDASSGTATLMEVARALGSLVKKGWKPKRTIVFASWGAEECGLIGSTEWVQEHAELLRSRAVAYVNIDIAVDGNHTFRALAMPVMEWVLMEATKKVPAPSGVGTVFQEWATKLPSSETSNLPKFQGMGAASDYVSFYEQIGIPCADLRYTYAKTGLVQNPLYHTLHDTFRLVETFLDPEFKFHQATARVWAQLTLSLADSVVIPFRVGRTGLLLSKCRDDMKSKYGSVLEANNVSLANLDDAILGYTKAAEQFQLVINNTGQTDTHNLRRINNRLVQLERAFIHHGTKPIIKSMPMRRHVLHTRPRGKGTRYLGGVVEAIRRANAELGAWEEVNKQVSIIVYAIKSAIRVLKLNPI